MIQMICWNSAGAAQFTGARPALPRVAILAAFLAQRAHQFAVTVSFGREKPQYGFDALAQIARAVTSAEPTVFLRLYLGITGGSARKRVPSRSRCYTRSVTANPHAGGDVCRHPPSQPSRRWFKRARRRAFGEVSARGRRRQRPIALSRPPPSHGAVGSGSEPVKKWPAVPTSFPAILAMT